MKTYSRTIFVLLVLMATLLAMAVSAQERAPVTPIKRTPSIILDTQARAKITPTPIPTPKLGLKIPGRISINPSLPEVFRERQKREPQQPKMPNVIGQHYKMADSMVRERQPNARINLTESPRYNPDYKPEAVIYQSLKEGADLKPGVEVTLVYNPQQSRVNYPKMPNVIGQHFQTANSMVRERQPRARISSTESPRYNTGFKPYAVIYQSLKEGADLKPGVEVALVYNPQQPGPAYPNMPDLIGMDIRSAQAKLSGEAPNYPQRSIEESEFDPRFRPGVVVNQSPRAGMALQPRGVAVMYYNPQEPKVTVPDVIGLTVLDARRRIEQNNLVARLPRRGDFNSYIVTGQSPQAGTVVETRSAVTLTVAATVIVPDVRRSLLDDAKQVISQNKLAVGAVTTRISSVRQDEVLSQSPAPNSVVVEGTAVNLVIAKPQQVRVPDVLNRQQGNAEQALVNARLAVGQVTTRESPRAAGTVLDQNPRAGTMVNIGSQVSLVIAIPETVFVPDLRNKTQGNAESLITIAKLVVGQITTRESPRAAGTVLDQSPSAGSRVNVGSPVNLVIAVPETVTVPNLRNRTQSNAEQMIANARLVVGQVTMQQATVAAGTVLSQIPPTGTVVNVGTQVSFVVAVPTPTPTPSPVGSTLVPTPVVVPDLRTLDQVDLVPNPVVVPDVRKLDLAEAKRLLREANLEVGEVTKEDSKEKADTVLKQQPSPGERIAAGSRVNLVIAKSNGINPIAAIAVIAVGFAAFLLGRLWNKAQAKRKENAAVSEPEPPPATIPTLSFRMTMNASSAEFSTSTDLHTSFALRFQPRADWGQQYVTVYGALIAAESEEL
jgi:beta-lactam-binding protein with PASTA domain